MNKNKRNYKRLIIIIISLFIILGLAALFVGYKMFFKNNVNQKNFAFYELKIYKDYNWDDIKKELYKDEVINNTKDFEVVANLMDYPEKIKSGNYRIGGNMSNLEIIRKLASGNQDPVKLIFNNIRTREEFAKKISEQLEIDSTQIISKLYDKDFTGKYNYNTETILCMFIPNTYEVYWNISLDSFFERMNKENKKFWTDKRKLQLSDIRLSETEAITLASIVEKETNQNSEKSRVAGVYMNRLKQGWPLQADPTLVFALGDFTIKRVLASYKSIDSPYNTYKNTGLPPGPICIPSISSIDAVLNYENHNYMFFCAKDDFSGYHLFATNIDEHNRNAAKYQKALGEMNIYK